MNTLQTNRYGVVTPNLLLDNGISIATPIYFNLPSDVTKAILNKFREVKLRQLLEMGWTDTKGSSIGALSVTTAEEPPQTAIEKELGMNEEALRYALFTRAGVQERLVLKLQNLLGIDLVTKEQIENCYQLWVDEFKFPASKANEKKTRKTSSTRTKAAAV